jgi:putative peptide zinc metalloprotease protein
MAAALFSPHWYRVAALSPQLRANARIHRHTYRGRTWFVLQDLASERFHRFSSAAYYVIGLMDGRNTVQSIWEKALAHLGDDAVSQDEVIQLLAQLHAADVLQSDVPPDTAEMFRRRETHARREWQRKALSIFSWQIPLYDPERLLARMTPWARPLFGWVGLVLWLLLVGTALTVAAAHWRELSENALDRVLLPHNLVLLWFIFPVLKLVHEFGHALAVKSFGGEVHEMGVMLLVFTPVPYVDASSSWAFRSKWQRFVVGGAGMMVELAVAALALAIWLAAEPGVLRAVAYNVMLIAGFTTVLFNANPLMRFDGYYMLSDFLEIPNLRTRSTQYLVYLCERFLFARQDAESPAATPGERAWFVAFALSSFIYRLFVIVGIFIFVGGMSLLLGVIFAGATSIGWVLVPAWKIVKYLASSPRIRRERPRAIRVSAALALVVTLLLAAVPLPLRTVAEGVVWIPEEGFARAGTDGFIEAIGAKPGAWVKPGEPLLVFRDLDLETEGKVLAGRVKELEAKHRGVLNEDKVKAQIVEEELRYARSSLASTEERLAELTVIAKAEGTFVLPHAADLPGRYIKKGELLAHIVNLNAVKVRAVVSQQEIDLVRTMNRGVEVRLAENIASTRAGSVSRIVPAASDHLPSAALGQQGGGLIAVDAADKEGRKSVQKFFQVDVDFPDKGDLLNVGGRAFVRFHHGWEPLAFQWFRHIRQVFLSRFNV